MGFAEEWRKQEIECDGIDANDAVRRNDGSFDLPVLLSERPTAAWVRSFDSVLERYDLRFAVEPKTGEDRIWLRGVPPTEQAITNAYSAVAQVVAETNPQYRQDTRQASEQYQPVRAVAERIARDLRDFRGR